MMIEKSIEDSVHSSDDQGSSSLGETSVPDDHDSLSKQTSEIPSKFSSFTAYSTEKKRPNSASLSSFKKEFVNNSDRLSAQHQENVFRDMNEYNRISMEISNSSMLDSENIKYFETNQETTNSHNNNKINEYLLEMANYYMDIQPNIQYRG